MIPCHSAKPVLAHLADVGMFCYEEIHDHIVRLWEEDVPEVEVRIEQFDHPTNYVITDHEGRTYASTRDPQEAVELAQHAMWEVLDKAQES